MSDLVSFTGKRGNNEYGITISCDEKELPEGVIDFGVTVFRRPANRDSNDKSRSVTAHVTVEEDKEKGALLKIKVGQTELYSKPLSDLVGAESAASRALESIHATAFGGDLVMGCLFRSGCSVTVGQVIACKNETATIRRSLKRAKAIGRCLLKHMPDMLAKTMRRATWCVLKAGF